MKVYVSSVCGVLTSGVCMMSIRALKIAVVACVKVPITSASKQQPRQQCVDVVDHCQFGQGARADDVRHCPDVTTVTLAHFIVCQTLFILTCATVALSFQKWFCTAHWRYQF